MQNFSSRTFDHSADLELPAPLVSAPQVTGFVQMLAKSLHPHGEGQARRRRLRHSVSRVYVQIEVVAIDPADTGAARKPELSTVSSGIGRAPAERDRVVWRYTSARGYVRSAIGEG